MASILHVDIDPSVPDMHTAEMDLATGLYYNDAATAARKLGIWLQQRSSQTGNRTPAAAVRAPNPNH
jgi:uncharacterized HAD superfamily protein